MFCSMCLLAGKFSGIAVWVSTQKLPREFVRMRMFVFVCSATKQRFSQAGVMRH